MSNQMPGIATLEKEAAITRVTCGSLLDPAVQLNDAPAG
jgi:hypothetical protein